MQDDEMLREAPWDRQKRRRKQLCSGNACVSTVLARVGQERSQAASRCENETAAKVQQLKQKERRSPLGFIFAFGFLLDQPRDC
eukprot:scaffold2577_cov254-Pinguiococcus_pyrenoidosus.AAC.4